jgi:hypothetical protein
MKVLGSACVVSLTISEDAFFGGALRATRVVMALSFSLEAAPVRVRRVAPSIMRRLAFPMLHCCNAASVI